MSRPAQERLPVEPVMELMARRTGGGADGGTPARGTGIKAVLGVDLAHEYHRCVADGGFTWGVADRVCVALGLHPWSVFGDLWWECVDLA